MSVRAVARSVAALAGTVCLVVALSSCSFGGVNSLPLPGAVASGRDAAIYHVQIANVGTLESNSPVMINDVVVGSVGKIRVHNWVADVEVRVRPEIAVPSNAVAKVGQTSLLGSMHVSLDPPVGQAPAGRLRPGSTLPLNRSSTYPSTEQTLASLSVVVNAGGLGQIGDLIHGAATGLSGREADVREMISRLDALIGVVDDQHVQLNSTIDSMNRFTSTLAAQKGDITQALRTVPAALDTLLQERARLVLALQELGRFGTTAENLVNSTQDDLVHNLTNLEPTIKALADVGPMLGTNLAYLPTFPLSQNFIDRAVRGDYINIWATMDLTIPRLKRSLFLGTRWGDPNANLVPAPGDPPHLNFNYEPTAPPPAQAPAPAPMPVSPPAEPTPPPMNSVFAGPYPAAGGH